MLQVLTVEPVFAPRMWGGTTLREWYADLVPDEVIGECWAVSGLPGRSGGISAGAPSGYTLEMAWRDGLITGQPREDDFPLLCKILDPADWLSVQVHPDDEQAHRLEGMPRGKAECWYVLECAPGAELIMGHRRDTAQQLRQDLLDGRLMGELISHPVHPGSFFMVPAGCVHAVGPGMLVYEVQQSSDITYRLYDFDRVGVDGTPRDLHVDKGFSVVAAPFDEAASLTAAEPVPVDSGTRRDLVANDYFAVTHWDIDGTVDFTTPEYRVATVVAGQGALSAEDQEVPLRRGVSLVIPRGVGPVTVTGSLSVMTTDPGPGL